MSGAPALLGNVAKVAGALGAVSLVAQNCLYVVQGGHRAVVWDIRKGVQADVKGEGLHFRVPFYHLITQYEVRSTSAVLPTTTGTRDLQQVSLTLRVLFRPDESKMALIHKELGPTFADRVLPSIQSEVLKTAIARFDASELITQREEVSSQIRVEFEKRAANFHLLVDDISITELAFSQQFTKAIEAKQVEQQRAEMAKFHVHQAEQEKKAAIIKAQGEAEAANLIRKATEKNVGFITLRRIEAAREIAEELAKSRNITYLPSSGGGGGSNVLLRV